MSTIDLARETKTLVANKSSREAERPLRRPHGWAAALAFGGMTLAVARLGSAVSRPGLWYRRLRKSRATPPSAAFGPIWAGLYAAMAVSAWRVWRAPDSPARSRALRLWGAQLGLNAAWSPTFFAAKRPGTALGIITALLPTLGRYVKYAREVDRLAARLMVPYLAWTGFATYLNGAIVSKNAGKIGSS